MSWRFIEGIVLSKSKRGPITTIGQEKKPKERERYHEKNAKEIWGGYQQYYKNTMACEVPEHSEALSVEFRTRSPGFKSQVCHFLAV